MLQWLKLGSYTGTSSHAPYYSCLALCIGVFAIIAIGKQFFPPARLQQTTQRHLASSVLGGAGALMNKVMVVQYLVAIVVVMIKLERTAVARLVCD